MFQPTDLDFANARLFSYERQKIVNYNYFCYKYPNIFKGKTFIRIRYNNSLPITNNPMESIKVDWCATKEFCNTIHCQKRLPNNGICDENSPPQLFKSGNSTVVACQAGCFENFAVDSEMKGPFLLYSEKQSICLLQVDHFFAMAIDPYLRTDIHPNPRIDTIGTGFDIDYENTYVDYSGNETYKYKLNKFYCDDFKLEFKGDSCQPSIGEEIANLFFSRVLYKAFQYGTRYFTTGVPINETQHVDTGPVDKSMTPMTKEQWRNDIRKSYYINPNVTLKDLGMTEDNYKLLIWTTEDASAGKLIVSESVYQSNSILHNSKGVSVVDFLSKNLHRPDHLKFRGNGVRLIDEYDFLGIYSYIQKETAYKGDDEKLIGEQILDFLKNDLPEIGISIVVPVVLESIIKRYMSLLRHVETSFSKINVSILRMTKNIFIQMYTPVFTRAIGKLIVTASKFIVNTLSGVLIVSNILGLIDLFAMGSDPYNLNKLVDEKFIDNYSELTIRGVREMFNVGEVEMSPIFYAYYLNNGKTVDIENENLFDLINIDTTSDPNYPSWAAKTIINSSSDPTQDIMWTTKYLKSLVYNSNHLKIDWDYDSEINLNDINEEELMNNVIIQYKDYMNGQEYKLRELKIIFYVSITILPFLLFLNFKIYVFVLFLISPLIIFQIYYPITLKDILSGSF